MDQIEKTLRFFAALRLCVNRSCRKNNFTTRRKTAKVRNGVFKATILVILTASLCAAQPAAGEYRRTHEREILAEFTQLLSIPNIASDRENIRRNADFIREMMQRRGLNPQLLEGKSADTPAAVYGEWKAPGATHSIILYAHYDGQPVDPKAWTASPPFQPTWRSAAMESGGAIVTLPASGEINSEWRLYARSASDDKAGVMAILTAFDGLKASGRAPSVNIKFLFEGEEEAGSPHLGDIIDLHKQLLESDALARRLLSGMH